MLAYLREFTYRRVLDGVYGDVFSGVRMTFDLYNVADSFEFLKRCPSGSVDHVITDPPYNAHVHANLISGTDVSINGGGIGVPHIDLPFAPLKGYDFARDLVRVAKRWALAFCAIEDFGEFKRAVGGDYKRGGIWYKPNAQGQMTGDRPAACYEGIAIMHSSLAKLEWNGRGSYGLWPCNGTRGMQGRHPNEKPVDLLLKLVALFTRPGEIVLDPFCGRGAIGEACILLGRHYVGLDLPEHNETRLVTIDGKRQKITERIDWVARSGERLSRVTPGSFRDEDALKLCTAKKSEIVAEATLPWL